MASITVRKLDDGLKRRLRVRAAENGHSMEQEVRDILRTALYRPQPEPENLASAIRARFAPLGGVELDEDDAPDKNLGTALHELFRPFGGVELEIPPRTPMRAPPKFD